jgi:hypothetical protein
MGQLKAYEKVIRRALAKTFAMHLAKPGEEMPHRFLVFWPVIKLIGIGPAIASDSERLSSPNELRSRSAEVFPSPHGVLAGLAVRGSIPTLHGVDAPAISDSEACHLKWLG